MSKAVTGLLKGVAGEVKRAAAGARQDVGGKQRPARPAKRRTRWFILPRASSCLYMGVAVGLLAVAREPSFLRELSRTATAVADVAEGAGSLASAATFAAANATVAVTTTAAGLASSSLSLAKEAWEGVDLLNVTANRSHGRVVASTLEEIEAGETSLDDMALGMGGADNTVQVNKPHSVADLYGNAALFRTVLFRCALWALASGFGYAAFFAYVARLPPSPHTELEPMPFHTPPTTPRPCSDGLLDGIAVVCHSASHALDGAGPSGSPHSPQTPSSRRRLEQAAQSDAAGR